MMQSEGGGFPWFKGGRDDRYITQYIISGIGHLKKLKAVPEGEEPALDKIAKSAIAYLDKELKSAYDHRPKKEEENISATQIQYLYMRSFFPEIGLPGSVFPAMNYYRKLAIQILGKTKYVSARNDRFVFIPDRRSENSKRYSCILERKCHAIGRPGYVLEIR